MRPALKSDAVLVRDVFCGVVFLILSNVFLAWVVTFVSRGLLPEVSTVVAQLVFMRAPEVILLGYFMWIYGGIGLADFIPRRRDYGVLGIALFVLLWAVGLLVGKEGVNMELHDSIRALPALQYWWGVILIVLVGPLLEEAIFRRYMLEILHLRFTMVPAILLTAGLETLTHWGYSLWDTIQLYVGFLFFGIVYINSRLVVSVMVHAFANALMLFLSK